MSRRPSPESHLHDVEFQWPLICLSVSYKQDAPHLCGSLQGLDNMLWTHMDRLKPRLDFTSWVVTGRSHLVCMMPIFRLHSLRVHPFLAVCSMDLLFMYVQHRFKQPSLSILYAPLEVSSVFTPCSVTESVYDSLFYLLLPAHRQKSSGTERRVKYPMLSL